MSQSDIINSRQIQWFPGHMTKTLRLMEKEIRNVDCVLQILDARIPLSSLNPEIERITAGKPHLYVLNKSDLADPEITKQWLAYFKSAGAGCIAMDSKQRGRATATKGLIEKELSALMEQVLEGEATMETISIIERVARVIVNSADCAIGRDAARLVLDGVQGFRDDYEEHILRHRCLGGMREPVPCVALCPAGVDIPGYLVLIKYGRYADAVRLIRKDNPFPSACAYICEHPCEARCRRNMIDDAVNIRGLKRYAVDNAGYVPQPDCAEPTGKKVAVIGGGPSGLSAAYYLALMGHKVTVYEKRARLGGMLRYGIPNYRLPREVLDAEIASMLALGIDVHVNVNVGDDVTFDELRQQNDALYIALGAHTDKKTGIEGEDAEGVISAVEMLREIGDDHMPDFRNKDIVVIGGGNVAMDVCRSAVRLGARKVSCVYRRRQEDMTALPEEVEGAVAEGVELVTLQAPVRIETDANGHAVALWTQPQIIGEMDKKGRPAPEKAKRSEKRIAADVVVVAIGQGVETHGFEQTKIAIKRGAFVAVMGLFFRSCHFSFNSLRASACMKAMPVVMAFSSGEKVDVCGFPDAAPTPSR